MKILVTGITGLLGSYLAREFCRLGELHGLRRKESRMDLLGELAQEIKWHEGDINDYSSLEDACEGIDLIVHSAGCVSYDPKDREKLIRVNVEGTSNIVNVMLHKKLKKLLYVSSVAALGRVHDISLVDETFKWTTSPLNTPYGISKYLGELEVWRGAQEGLEVMVFNPSVLLGRISDQRSSTAIYNYVLEENKYYPLGSINYIDIRDAAKMMLQLYHSGQWNNRYIINKESIPYQTFFEMAADAFRKKAPSKPASGLMVKVAVAGASVGNLFKKRKSPLTLQTARISQQAITFDNSKANHTIHFTYTPLESTLAWAAGNSI